MATRESREQELELLLEGYFPETLNRTHRQHWSRVRKHKQRAMEHLHVACLQQHGVVPAFEGRVRVAITRRWGKGQRALEIENAYGAVKPLVDAMRAQKPGRNQHGTNRQGGLGIIEDDDPARLALTVFQERNPTGDQPATLITLIGKRVA